jgi:hypothetical protein
LVTDFFIMVGVAGAGVALPITDLGTTNRFHTSEALGFVVATAGEATTSGLEFAVAKSGGTGSGVACHCW